MGFVYLLLFAVNLLLGVANQNGVLTFARDLIVGLFALLLPAHFNSDFQQGIAKALVIILGVFTLWGFLQSIGVIGRFVLTHKAT